MRPGKKAPHPTFAQVKAPTTAVPRWPLEDGRLWRWPDACVRVYLALCFYARGDVATYPLVHTLCTLARLGTSAVYDALARLERDGVILRFNRGGGDRRVYYVLTYPGLSRENARRWSEAFAAPAFRHGGGEGSATAEGGPLLIRKSLRISAVQGAADDPAAATPPRAAAAGEPEGEKPAEARRRLAEHGARQRTIDDMLAQCPDAAAIIDMLDNAEAIARRYARRGKPFSVIGYVRNHYLAPDPLVEEVKRARAAAAAKVAGAARESAADAERRAARELEKRVDETIAAMNQRGLEELRQAALRAAATPSAREKLHALDLHELHRNPIARMLVRGRVARP